MGRVALVLLIACSSERLPPPPRALPAALALVSPGPVFAGHDGLACGACHVNDTKAIANDKCLDCHRALRDRIAFRRGFHASWVVLGKPCAECHLDHRGRTFDPMGWEAIGGLARFEHETMT